MRIALVLGKQLSPSGAMTAEYVAQMQKAVSLLSADKVDIILITGGVTRAGFPSEAEVGLSKVPKELRTKVMLEKCSKSTSENIRFVLEMLGSSRITSMIVVGSTGQDRRTRFLIKRLWPEILPVTKFDSVPTTSAKEKVAHFVLYVLTLIDPDDEVFVPFIKKYSRAG